MESFSLLGPESKLFGLLVGTKLTSFEDQWVADRTRDHIIAARGSQKRDCSTEECKCEMYIDDRRIPHDFCTTQRKCLGSVKGSRMMLKYHR